MPTIQELRARWFLDFNAPVPAVDPPFPAIARHPGSLVSHYTDGNLVTPLIDGQNYMKEWHDAIEAMINKPDCEVYMADWRFEAVKTLGEQHQHPDDANAIRTLNNADNGGVSVYPLIDFNKINLIPNIPSALLLLGDFMLNTCVDQRYPLGGSNHQKLTCLKYPGDPQYPKALMGSIDIAKTRWDTNAHATPDYNRAAGHGPTHDTGVLIQGPAVADLEQTFVQRWNDLSRILNLFGWQSLLREGPPPQPPPPPITTPVSPPGPRKGPHSIQVLRTYGRTNVLFGYSWSPTGEFTGWASYLNAIKNARTYIYIEDQYFLPFDWPPCHTRGPGKARNSDIIYQLGEAIKRGVKVAVLVPSNAEDLGHHFQEYQRNIGVSYLAGLSYTHSGDFVIASPHNGTEWIYVHSKLMIVDDEFVLIGSTNIGQRSMSHDSELHVGIVDETNLFAKDLRKDLWAEHLQRSAASLNDPVIAYGLFQSDTLAGRGRVRPYNATHANSPPEHHAAWMRYVADPYSGPSR